jgi:diguanylate cyclase (GGDEF)-like protein
LKDNVKGSDIVARFGGEEFCVVLKRVDQKRALEFFFKLRTIIATTPIHAKGQKAFNFTVSIGVTFSDLERLDDMLKQSDAALYNAKKKGKNRVEVA